MSNDNECSQKHVLLNGPPPPFHSFYWIFLLYAWVIVLTNINLPPSNSSQAEEDYSARVFDNIFLSSTVRSFPASAEKLELCIRMIHSVDWVFLLQRFQKGKNLFLFAHHPSGQRTPPLMLDPVNKHQSDWILNSSLNPDIWGNYRLTWPLSPMFLRSWWLDHLQGSALFLS